ncbi:MAG: polysaccharide biosynthesis C-terminal domain-containing protein, partial [Pseudothermotoga sp.]
IRMQKKGLLFSGLIVVNSLSNVAGTIVYALLISRDFYSIVFGQIIGNLSAFLVGSFADNELRRFSKVSLSKIKEHLKFGVPFLPTSLLFWLFSSIDRISLRQYSTFNEIGLYSAAFKIVSVMNLVQAGFTTFWTPVVYERYETDSEPRDFFRKANLIVSCVMFLFGFLVLGFKDLIFLLLNRSYREAAYIAPFLILYPIMYTISETTVMGINFTKKTYWHIVVTGVSATVNFVGNTLLVPHLGARGAAISTGLSYILFFTMRTMISERLYKIGFELRKVYIGTIVIVFVALVGTLIRSFIGTMLSSLIGVLAILLLYRKSASIVYKTIGDFLLRKK